MNENKPTETSQISRFVPQQIGTRPKWRTEEPEPVYGPLTDEQKTEALTRSKELLGKTAIHAADI